MRLDKLMTRINSGLNMQVSEGDSESLQTVLGYILEVFPEI